MNVAELKKILESYNDDVEIIAEWEGQKISFGDDDVEMENGILEIWVDNYNNYSEAKFALNEKVK